MIKFEFQLPSVQIAIAFLITLALVFILLGLKKTTRIVIDLIRYRKLKYVRSIKIKNFEVLHVDRFSQILKVIVQCVRAALTIILIYFYIPLILGVFPWTKHLAPHIYSTLLHPLAVAGSAVLGFIPDLLVILAVLGFVRFLLKVVHGFFREVESGRLHLSNFHSEWAEPTYKLVRIFIFAFAFAAILPYIPGSKSSAFQGVSVFIGVLFSFGSSSAMGNMVSGVLLTYMRPFKLGDRVKIADTEGDITEKSLLVTRIRTIKNVDVTIPNSMILGSHIINFSSSSEAPRENPGLILNTRISMGYHVPWQKVHELLIQSALATEHILQDPEPFVFQKALDDFYVVYEINAYTRKPNLMVKIYSDLHKHIQEKFVAAGIDMISPHFTMVAGDTGLTLPSSFTEKNRTKRVFASTESF